MGANIGSGPGDFWHWPSKQCELCSRLRALARLPYKFERERLARDLISGSELLRQWLDDPAATAAELDALALSDEAAGRDERDTILLYR